MVNGKDYRSLIVARFDLLQLCCEEVELVVGNRRPLCLTLRRFAGDNTRIFEGIRKQSEDADEGSIEREVDARLRHASAVKRSCFFGNDDRRAAEVAGEDGQRVVGRRGARKDERVVIPWNRQNWRGIIAERFVELIVVIKGFAEVVDDIAKMIEKRRTGCGRGSVEVVGHGVGNFEFGCVLRLRRCAAVTDHVKRDALGRIDGVDDVGAVRAPGLRKREEISGIARRLVERDDVFGE